MTPTEMADALDAVAVQIAALTTDPREWGRDDLQGAVEVWDRIDRLITDLVILRRDHGIVLARRIPDEYRAETRNGVVTLHREPSVSVEWDGWELTAALAEPMINTDGERIEAIPLDDVRAVVPACGQGATSSKWKITELRQRLTDADKFRRTTFGDTTVARGPQYRRRSTPPVHEPVTEPSESHAAD